MKCAVGHKSLHHNKYVSHSDATKVLFGSTNGFLPHYKSGWLVERAAEGNSACLRDVENS